MIFPLVHDAGSDIVPTAVADVDVELVVIVVDPSNFHEDPAEPATVSAAVLPPYCIATNCLVIRIRPPNR